MTRDADCEYKALLAWPPIRYGLLALKMRNTMGMCAAVLLGYSASQVGGVVGLSVLTAAFLAYVVFLVGWGWCRYQSKATVRTHPCPTPAPEPERAP